MHVYVIAMIVCMCVIVCETMLMSGYVCRIMYDCVCETVLFVFMSVHVCKTVYDCVHVVRCETVCVCDYVRQCVIMCV